LERINLENKICFRIILLPLYIFYGRRTAILCKEIFTLKDVLYNNKAIVLYLHREVMDNMLSKDSILTKQDFNNIKWEDYLKSARNQECYDYADVLLKQANEASEPLAKEALLLLGIISNFKLDLDYREEPFKNTFILYHGDNIGLDDVPDCYMTILRELSLDDIDCELRARICDILWVRNRDYRDCQLAVQSYLASFHRLIDFEHWTACITRIERALQLAASLGRKNQFFLDVVHSIEEAIDQAKGQDPFFFSARLMELLQHHSVGDGEKYAQLSEAMAKRFELQKDWRLAQTYWRISAQWHQILKNEDEETEKLIQAAESYVKQAVDTLLQSGPRYSLASAHIQSAIEALRNIPGTNERIQELHRMLLDYQKLSLKEMVPISTDPIDVSNMQAEAIKLVEKRTFEEAIFTLATMTSPPKVKKLEKTVMDLDRKFLFRRLFASVIVNESGKVVDRRPSTISDDPNQVQEALRLEMYANANHQHLLCTVGLIEPARQQIILDHPVRIHDLYSLLKDNPFIPQSRIYTYARGLHAGFHGDFIVSTHLLLPQLEHSIRELLDRYGVITSGIDAEGIQDEKSLNKLLFMPQLEELFGKDLVFDLQGLLVERYGSNLRNKFAHGLIDDSGFVSCPTIYTWWTILRICCLYKLAKINH
jgi:hypothetical protein